MKAYIITTNKREVEVRHLSGKLARADFYNKEIFPHRTPGGDKDDERIIKVRRKKQALKQLTIFDDPTYHENE